MELVTILLAIGAGATGLIGVATIIRFLFRTFVKVNEVWELLTRELQPNGGGSTYDRIREMNHSLRTQETLLRLHIEDSSAHHRGGYQKAV